MALENIDTDVLIQNELNRFLENKRQDRIRLTKKILFIITVLGVVAGSILLAPRLGRWLTYRWRFAQTRFAVKIVKDNLKTIKNNALLTKSAEYFSDYHFSESKTSPEVKLLQLIHQFSNDFYSKSFAIQPYEERRIYAFADMNGFDLENFYNLERPMLDDSSQTLKQWLLNKLLQKQSNYYNPRYGELLQIIEVYRSEYHNEMKNPLAHSAIRNIRRELVGQEIEHENRSEIIDKATGYLISNPAILAREQYYQKKLMELELELNIRLALFHMVLARDYKIRGNTAIYGWICGDMKGATLIREPHAPEKYSQFHADITSQVNAYNASYIKARKLYNITDFNDLQLIIHNPLRIGLVVKDIGLFGVSRKNSRGIRYEHKGIDLIAEEGTPVYPVQDGFVCYVGNDGSGHGNHIEIWHDSHIRSIYSHLKKDKMWQAVDRRFKEEGPFLVTTDERIASVGTSGNIPEGDAQYGYSHLHLEIRESGKPINPFLIFNDKIKVIH